MASKRIINSFLAGMIAMSLISGAFFVYESFNKLALGKVTEYTQMAHKYSRASPNAKSEANMARVYVQYRSFGLLERNSTSAIWMMFGFFTHFWQLSHPVYKTYTYLLYLLCLLHKTLLAYSFFYSWGY